MADYDTEDLNAANIKAMVDLVVDTNISETLRVNILNKLLEGSEGENFFTTMFQEKLSFGECPECGHENHWLVPEDELNKVGWASHMRDERVARVTDAISCDKWEEACKKKKVTI
jgi:hypothetical protein